MQWHNTMNIHTLPLSTWLSLRPIGTLAAHRPGQHSTCCLSQGEEWGLAWTTTSLHPHQPLTVIALLLLLAVSHLWQLSQQVLYRWCQYEVFPSETVISKEIINLCPPFSVWVEYKCYYQDMGALMLHCFKADVAPEWHCSTQHENKIQAKYCL